MAPLLKDPKRDRGLEICPCHLRLATRMASSGIFEDGPALVLSHSGRLETLGLVLGFRV